MLHLIVNLQYALPVLLAFGPSVSPLRFIHNAKLRLPLSYLFLHCFTRLLILPLHRRLSLNPLHRVLTFVDPLEHPLLFIQFLDL